MTNSKSMSKSTILSVALIIVSLIVIVGTTLAYFTDRVSKNSSMQFGKITLVGGQGMVSGTVKMTDKLPGDKITDTISFSKAVDSESMYVRAKVSFTTSGNDTVKAYVEELNKGTFAIKEYTDTNYKWSERMGNYYYLMDMTGDTVHTLNTNEEIILADSLVLSTELTQDEFKSQYMQEISLSVEIQAIQTANITNDFDTVNTKFGEVFGEKAVKPFVRQGMRFGKYEDADNQFSGFYYVDYGYYPQSLVSDVDVSNLTITTGETYTINNTSYDVYEYNSKQYIQYSNNVYEVEPVRWLILGYGDNSAIADGDISISNGTLSINDTSKGLLVLSEKVLTSSVFNPNVGHVVGSGDISYNDWMGSSIYTFMNGVFVKNLFTEDELNSIKPTTLKTTCKGNGYSVYALDNANNKLFLLSCTQGSYDTDTYQAQQNLKSDLNNAISGTTYPSLQAKASDLGYATGCTKSTVAEFYGNTMWWLRAGQTSSIKACMVDYNGNISSGSISTALGVRPAFVMSLA